MSYAIIGFGQAGPGAGQGVCPQPASKYPLPPRASRKVSPPPRPRSDPGSFPQHSTQAVKADIIFLAVRYESHRDVAKALPTWKGKTIVDVTNAYGVRPRNWDGQPSAKVVAQAFTGGKTGQGLQPSGRWPSLTRIRPIHGGRSVVFLASDDDGAAAEIAALAGKARFRADQTWRAVGRRTAGARARKQLGATDFQGPGQVRLILSTPHAGRLIAFLEQSIRVRHPGDRHRYG